MANTPNPAARRHTLRFIKAHGTTTDLSTIQDFACDLWGAWIDQRHIDGDHFATSERWAWLISDLQTALTDAGITITDLHH